MSDSETKIVDVRGRISLVVKSGRRLTDAMWRPVRIVLSNQRLILVTKEGKKSISLDQIEGIGGRYDVNRNIAHVTDYTSLDLGNRVIVLQPEDDDIDLTWRLYVALLDKDMILARHPAVKGGVLQDTEWEEAKLKLSSDTVTIAARSGMAADIPLDDIATVDTSTRTVDTEARPVVEVEHQDDSQIVQTYLSGDARQVSFMDALFTESQQRHAADLDLSRDEKQVLMALYSGVSPFDIADFTGLEPGEVEETYDRLIDLDVLEAVRERREVTLTSKGRSMASTASSGD